MNYETIGPLESDNMQNPIDLDPGLQVIPSDYVLVMDAPDFETAEIVCATLAAEGIHAVMQHSTPNPGSNLLPALGNTYSRAVYVAPSNAEAALALLAASAPSEEELAAEQAADPTTLEEAENNVRNA